MKVFLYTNVWLSALVFPGLCAELLVELTAREYTLLTSDLVRAETHEVLKRKFPRHVAAIKRFDGLWSAATRVPDEMEPADDADARLVAAAQSSGAALFITGDQRVLGWETQGDIHIVTPRQAWERVVAGNLIKASGAKPLLDQ
jgi:putative PIN family toxin of toxin-antitoxin system